MQLKYVKVKFLVDWMGNPKGSILTIIERMADILKQRKTVEFVEKNISDFEVEESVETKALEDPPIHKMIESPQVKKEIVIKPIKARGRK